MDRTHQHQLANTGRALFRKALLTQPRGIDNFQKKQRSLLDELCANYSFWKPLNHMLSHPLELTEQISVRLPKSLAHKVATKQQRTLDYMIKNNISLGTSPGQDLAEGLNTFIALELRSLTNLSPHHLNHHIRPEFHQVRL